MLTNLPIAISPFRDRIPLVFHGDGGVEKGVVVYYIGDGLLIIVLRIEMEYNCGGIESYRGGEGLNFHLKWRMIASYYRRRLDRSCPRATQIVVTFIHWSLSFMFLRRVTIFD